MAINPVYPKAQIKKVRELSLHDFLDQKTFKQLQAIVKKQKTTKKLKPGQYSYAQAECTRKIKQLFFSKDVLEFIKSLTGKIPKNSRIMIAQWKDHTLLHDKTKQKPGREKWFRQGNYPCTWQKT